MKSYSIMIVGMLFLVGLITGCARSIPIKRPPVPNPNRIVKPPNIVRPIVPQPSTRSQVVKIATTVGNDIAVSLASEVLVRLGEYAISEIQNVREREDDRLLIIVLDDRIECYQIPAGEIIVDFENDFPSRPEVSETSDGDIIVMLPSRTAEAPEPDRNNATLNVINNSSQSICYLFISLDTSDTWGEDVLDSDQIIGSGDELTFNLEAGMYDLRAENCDGEEIQESNDNYLEGSNRWNVQP